jgi:pimeloyl-ACP methyl ester carboxylesterase
MTETNSDDLYAAVPEEQRERLQKFRDNHPLQRVTIEGFDWEYIDSGQGEETVLLLVGGLRVADAAFRSIPMLEDRYRVITPSFPPIRSMAQIADGLAGVLAATQVERAHVLAGSFGGMVAQCFVRRHPDRLNSLMLSTTGVLDSESAQRYRQQMDALSPLPEAVVREGAKEQFFTIIAPPEHEADFWRAYLDELFSYRLGKDDLLSTLQCVIDYTENYFFSLNDLVDWPGKMLILESDDDKTFDETIRAALRVLYPQARVHTFHGAGHSPGTTQRDEYFRVVKTFLSGQDC